MTQKKKKKKKQIDCNDWKPSSCTQIVNAIRVLNERSNSVSCTPTEKSRHNNARDEMLLLLFIDSDSDEM